MHLISMKLIIALALLIVAATGLYNTVKPLPAGLSRAGSLAPLYDPHLLTDVTWHDRNGGIHTEQTIFPEIFRLIGQARKLIVLDMFLFNDTAPDDSFTPLADQLTDALIARRQAHPDLRIVVITDPINTVYGGRHSPHLRRLAAMDIEVVETRLPALRDSNPLWSSVWRVCCQWLGNSPDRGWLPNALGTGKVTLRSYLTLANFRANHRKTLIVDEGERLRGLVTSANPHDGSSRHWNIALSFAGPVVHSLLASEQAVLNFSAPQLAPLTAPGNTLTPEPATSPRGQILTESRIRQGALDMLQTAPAGSRVDLAMFYLSHRGVVTAMIAAARRGVALRVLLDGNTEAFGFTKNGIPNRQVAMELHRAGIPVRWCRTAGEQCHSKLLVRRDPDSSWQMLLGSANFTRRNLDDLNLETDIRLFGDRPDPVLAAAGDYFERLWRARPGQEPAFSLPYEANADESILRYWRYRIMEASGLSTF